MLRAPWPALLALLLIVPPASPADVPAAPNDPDVVEGVKQVDDGEYDKAILTLDNAARRLAGDPAKVADLSQAYLYLGIAYIGKGHEAAAKAKFREALRQIKDLTLSPEKYPPKVIDAFEEAKEEEAKAPAVAEKKGGSKKGLIIGGVLAAGAAVGVAAAAGGGGEGDSGGQPSGGGLTTRNFTGVVANEESSYHTVTPTRSGTLTLVLTWQDPTIRINIGCQQQSPPYNECDGNDNRTSDTSARREVTVTQQEYLISVYNNSGRPGSEPYTLTATYP